MKRIKRLIRSPRTTMIMFGLAAALLLFSSIGGTQAALTYFSDVYESQLQMYNIGVTLMEKNDGSEEGQAHAVSFRDYGEASDGQWSEGTGVLLEGMLADSEELKPGKKYNEELSVQNTGDIDQYVRVHIYKYWMKDGEKLRDLDPGLIELNLANTAGQGGRWIVDEEAATKERTVLYYSEVLPAGSTTVPFTDTLRVNDAIASKVTQEVSQNKGLKTIKTIYDYDGVMFCVEAKVDAVQDHNAEDAVESAWGRSVSVHGKTLSLN